MKIKEWLELNKFHVLYTPPIIGENGLWLKIEEIVSYEEKSEYSIPRWVRVPDNIDKESINYFIKDWNRE
jgi:hypothetical protein